MSCVNNIGGFSVRSTNWKELHHEKIKCGSLFVAQSVLLSVSAIDTFKIGKIRNRAPEEVHFRVQLQKKTMGHLKSTVFFKAFLFHFMLKNLELVTFSGSIKNTFIILFKLHLFIYRLIIFHRYYGVFR